MKELLTAYRYPFCFLTCATVAFFVFLIVGLSGAHSLFGRGGSVVVLLGAAAEYSLLQVQQQKLNEKVKGVGAISGQVLQDLDIPAPFPRLQLWAHISVIIGTFIWGFGDCMLSGNCAS